MNVRLGRVVILVEDHDKALRFYTEVLGCRVLFDGAEGGRRYVHVAFGDDEAGVWLLRPESPAGARRVGAQTGGEPVAVVYADALDETLSRWRAAGARVSQEPQGPPDGARFAHVLDLYGNELVLVELPPAPRPARVGTAFVPVTDPATAADWYAAAFGLTVRTSTAWSALLDGPAGSASLTLMGPASGIRAQPGLPFATHNLVVDDVDAARERLVAAGLTPSGIDGDPAVCRFFTTTDPDGNVLLVCDR
jgi:predicted enzyme related to lactoylglutathione lyase